MEFELTKPTELNLLDIEQHMASILPEIIAEVLSDNDDLGLPAKVKLIEGKMFQSEERFVKMFEQKKKKENP